jgi:hypothetical protein
MIEKVLEVYKKLGPYYSISSKGELTAPQNLKQTIYLAQRAIGMHHSFIVAERGSELFWNERDDTSVMPVFTRSEHFENFIRTSTTANKNELKQRKLPLIFDAYSRVGPGRVVLDLNPGAVNGPSFQFSLSNIILDSAYSRIIFMVVEHALNNLKDPEKSVLEAFKRRKLYINKFKKGARRDAVELRPRGSSYSLMLYTGPEVAELNRAAFASASGETADSVELGPLNLESAMKLCEKVPQIYGIDIATGFADRVAPMYTTLTLEKIRNMYSKANFSLEEGIKIPDII